LTDGPALRAVVGTGLYLTGLALLAFAIAWSRLYLGVLDVTPLQLLAHHALAHVGKSFYPSRGRSLFAVTTEDGPVRGAPSATENQDGNQRNR
jgi:hypothetical protein